MVFSPQFGRTGPFSVYFGPNRLIPPGRVRVPELDVAALANYGGFGPGAGRPPSGPPPRAPAGYRMVKDVSTPTYRLVVFATRHPRVMSTRELRRMRFPHSRATLVWQLPPGFDH
jgi:hypothetical protein